MAKQGVSTGRLCAGTGKGSEVHHLWVYLGAFLGSTAKQPLIRSLATRLVLS